MHFSLRVTSLLLVSMAAAAAPLAAQDRTYRAPRTESGQPDLQGVWNFDSGVPLERPAAFADRKVFTKEEFEQQRAGIRKGLEAIARLAPIEAIGFDWIDHTLRVNDLRTSLITYPTNGRLPAVGEGVRRMPRFEDLIAALSGATSGQPPASLLAFATMFGGKKDSYTDFSVFERCLLAADVPFVPQLTENYVQIVQSRDYVVLLMEFDRRIITLDGRPAATGPQRSWTGTSRGHWEGDTLVVETKDFHERMRSFAGAGSARDKIVTERFTRTSSNVIEYAATVVDPKTFRDRIELSFPMAQVDAHLYEGACHEGNRSLANALSAARKGDATPPRQQLTVFDRQGAVVKSVGEAGSYSQATFSPDGSRLAVVSEGASQDIWVFDVATGARRQRQCGRRRSTTGRRTRAEREIANTPASPASFVRDILGTRGVLRDRAPAAILTGSGHNSVRSPTHSQRRSFHFVMSDINPRASQFGEYRQAIRDLCGRFGSGYWQDVDSRAEYPDAFVRALTEAGWLAALIPEEYGGGGLGVTEASVILEEINRSGANSGACHAQMYIMGALVRHGSEAQKRKYLPDIASGALRLQSFAVTEPTVGTDTTKIRTMAVRRGDRYVINGQKVWTSRMQHSDLMLLLARTTPLAEVTRKTHGLSLFLVDLRESGAEGLTVRPIRNMVNHETNEVFFEGFDVPAENLIGQEGEGFRAVLDGMNAERILIAAECIGDGYWFVERARAYASERVVFDRPIGQNQGIQFPIARAYANVRAADLMRYEAARLFDEGRAAGAEANLAKLLAADASWEAANVCLQTFGGFGFAAEYDVERKFRETRLYQVAPISTNLILSYLAEHVLGLPRSF